MKVKNETRNNKSEPEIISAFENGVFAALETYSNVHRGNGHNSIVTTHLYEQAREIVLDYLGLDNNSYAVIFGSPVRISSLANQLEPGKFHLLSGNDTGLSLGVRALVLKKKTLNRIRKFQSGGGSARLVSTGWIIWAGIPDKFEAGTPQIVNIIAFAKALSMIKRSGKGIFQSAVYEECQPEDILHHDELENYSGKELLVKLRESLIGRGLMVPTINGWKPFINLDNSASTQTFTPIWNTFRKTLYQPQEEKEKIIREVRSICSKVLSAPLSAYEMVFTSNTTEAINLVAESMSRNPESGVEPVILNSLLEHSSNDLPWRGIDGHSLIRLQVDEEGFFDLKELENLLSAYNQENKHGSKKIRLVALSGASNVLGICNNLKEISGIVHKYGAKLLVDAAQLVAHRKVDVEGSGADFLAFSGHKVYAPFGTGVLICRKGFLNFNDAEMKLIHTSGEENAGGIAALGKSFELLQRIGMEVIRDEEQELTIKLLAGLSRVPDLQIYGVKDPESPAIANKTGVVVFNLKKLFAHKAAKELALQSGIGVRSGCHCAHIIIKRLFKFSPFLENFQRFIIILFPKLTLPGLVRVSLGIGNRVEDVDELIIALEKISVKKPKPGDSGSKSFKADIRKKLNEFVEKKSREVYL